MNEEESVILIYGIDPGTVDSIRKRLEEKGIESVHISTGYRLPTPVGVRVLMKDYDESVKILQTIGLEPYKDSEVDGKWSNWNLLFLLVFGGISIIFVVLVILGVFG